MRWGWIAGALVALTAIPAAAAPQPEPVPRWEARRLPDIKVGPDCKRVANTAEDFSLGIKRGVQLAYASPITVSGWRSPESACRRWNAMTRLNLSRFRWQNWELVEQSLTRLEFETQVSYVWQYDKRYTLQRLEPGVAFYGTLEVDPRLRFYIDVRLADYWHVRLEDTVNLAQLAGAPDWRAKMGYAF